MLIRPVVPEDVEAVLELEQSSASAWTGPAILSELDRKEGIQLAAVEAGTESLLGWCCALIAADEAELLKIGVTRSARRKGVATTLLAQLEDICRRHQVKKIFLEVRRGNGGARALYATCGYSKGAVRKNYYRNPVEDAVIYVNTL